MNKKLLAIMIAATLLQGCTSFRQAENTRKDAVAEQQRAREMIAELRNRTPVVKESPRQWINPRPVTDKNPGNAVPGCPIIINTRQSITLQQVAQRISENCHIPVRKPPTLARAYFVYFRERGREVYECCYSFPRGKILWKSGKYHTGIE